jgi:hypothetical protein
MLRKCFKANNCYFSNKNYFIALHRYLVRSRVYQRHF